MGDSIWSPGGGIVRKELWVIPFEMLGEAIRKGSVYWQKLEADLGLNRSDLLKKESMIV